MAVERKFMAGAYARAPFVEFEGRADLAPIADRLAAVGRQVEPPHRVLANSPQALGAFVEMSAFIRNGSTLPARSRELIALATAAACGSTFVWSQHAPLAGAASVTQEEIDAVAVWPGERDALSPSDRALVGLAYELADRVECSADSLAALTENLAWDQIVDVLITIGWYQLCATIFGALDLSADASDR